MPLHKTPLTNAQILAWADDHHAKTGFWPISTTGPVLADPKETWRNIDAALRMGLRKLPKGGSLAKLLASERGVRNIQGLPKLTKAQIAAWARLHHKRTGQWPNAGSGSIMDAPGETWLAIESALREGTRGLPGGESLGLFLARRLGVRTRAVVRPLTEEIIRTWAVAHQKRTGTWPTVCSGPVVGAPGETWDRINRALHKGYRGLPGGNNLARLQWQNPCPTRTGKPDLTEAMILEWADYHRKQTGMWPMQRSGKVLGVEGEMWAGICGALQQGHRGLPGGDTLHRLLQRERGKE